MILPAEGLLRTAQRMSRSSLVAKCLRTVGHRLETTWLVNAETANVRELAPGNKLPISPGNATPAARAAVPFDLVPRLALVPQLLPISHNAVFVPPGLVAGGKGRSQQESRMPARMSDIDEFDTVLIVVMLEIMDDHRAILAPADEERGGLNYHRPDLDKTRFGLDAECWRDSSGGMRWPFHYRRDVFPFRHGDRCHIDSSA